MALLGCIGNLLLVLFWLHCEVNSDTTKTTQLAQCGKFNLSLTSPLFHHCMQQIQVHPLHETATFDFSSSSQLSNSTSAGFSPDWDAPFVAAGQQRCFSRRHLRQLLRALRGDERLRVSVGTGEGGPPVLDNLYTLYDYALCFVFALDEIDRKEAPSTFLMVWVPICL